MLLLYDGRQGLYYNDSEERNISESIAPKSSRCCHVLKPQLSAPVTGEGSSGGALAIGGVIDLICCSTAPILLSLQEGCANIIWKTSEKAPQAA